jgi:hypothetical protein
MMVVSLPRRDAFRAHERAGKMVASTHPARAQPGDQSPCHESAHERLVRIASLDPLGLQFELIEEMRAAPL